MTCSFLETKHKESLKHLDEHGNAFEADEDIGGIVKKVLVRRGKPFQRKIEKP